MPNLHSEGTDIRAKSAGRQHRSNVLGASAVCDWANVKEAD
jgi:hypothetical protein